MSKHTATGPPDRTRRPRAEQDRINGPPVWTRQGGETSKAFAAFCVYRDLGPSRSLRKAAEKDKGTKLARTAGRLSQFEKWSRKYGWVSRCAAFDGHEQEEARLNAAEDRSIARDRRLQVTRGLLGKLLQRLAQLEPDRISVRELLRGLALVHEQERAELGEPKAGGSSPPGADGADPFNPLGQARVVVYLPENGRQSPPAAPAEEPNGIEPDKIDREALK